MRSDAVNHLLFELALGAGSLYSLWLAFKSWREGRVIDDTPTSRIRSAAQGYVELDGRGRCAPGVETRAPLTRQPCTWWSYKIEEAGRSRRSNWTVIERDSSVAPFVLDDGTGTCLIDPRGAQVFGAHKTVWYGSTSRPDVRIPDGTSMLGKIFDFCVRGDFRYTELRLRVDAPLYAIGTFKSVGGAANPDAQAAVAELLRGWKRDQPALLQRFDTNHDGVLDQREWEAARGAALAQVERAALARPVVPTTQVLQAPDDGRCFLLGQCDAATLARRFRWRFAAGVAGFVAGVALLGWTWRLP